MRGKHQLLGHFAIWYYIAPIYIYIFYLNEKKKKFIAYATGSISDSPVDQWLIDPVPQASQ